MLPDSRALAGGVEVTCLDMDAADAPVDDYWRTLSADERTRADGFRFAEHRRRFIVRRGVLRALLSRRLGRDAASISYSRNRYGKLSVSQSDIRFNVSSSHSVALFALVRGEEVGCDIERIDPDFDYEPVAERFFARAELAELRSAPAPRRRAWFFRYWTLKEAYVKCRGVGMSLPPERVSVARVTGMSSARDAVHDIKGASFEPMPGYQAALVAETISMDARFEWHFTLDPETTR